MSALDRIKRAFLGPTDEEISAKSQALAGPPYPIPPNDTRPPTGLVDVDPDYWEDVNERAEAAPVDYAPGDPDGTHAASEYIATVVSPEQVIGRVVHDDDSMGGWMTAEPGGTVRPWKATHPGAMRPAAIDIAEAAGSRVPDVGRAYPIPRLLDRPRPTWTAAPPAIVCDGCGHAAHMHPDEDAERLAPSCIGEGPGYACPCTHTCQQINDFVVAAHTYTGAPMTDHASNDEQAVLAGRADELSDPYDSMKGGVSDADEFTGARRDDDMRVAAFKPADEYTRRGVDDSDIDVSVHDIEDSGVHTLEDDPGTSPPTVKSACPTCEGHGYVTRTVNELLRESVGLIPVDGGDMVIKEFYTRLLRAAPHLAPLFPRDLLTAATQDDASPGALQRDRLLNAIVALAELYGSNRQDMDRLDQALATFGRAHAAFARPDGTVQGATPAEYMVVKDVFVGVLVDVSGDRWRPEYTTAWSEAYDYAMVGMLYAQYHSGMTAPRWTRRDAA